MDNVKEAFKRVKDDIDFLRQETILLKLKLEEIRKEMINMCQILEVFTQKQPKIPFDTSTHKPQKKTTPTYSSTHNIPLEPLNTQNIGISIGNQGVPTDRQTNRQTNRHMDFEPKMPKIPQIQPPQPQEDSIENASKILDSLDNIKKQIRLKFKRLTDQEILVFSTIYQLEEEKGYTDYKDVSDKLNLSESSIRDYVGRLIKKGIPVDKKKINNKTIHLSISKNLKKIASLSTILQLRDI